MATTLLLVVSASFSAIALGLSVVSLALHYSRRNEHPAVAQLKADHLDLLDKVEHWMKRDRVRRLRASQEAQEPEQPNLIHLTPQEQKAALRARVFADRRVAK